MTIYYQINEAVAGQDEVLNLEEFGENSDLPHACQPIAGLQFYDYDKVDQLIGRIRPQRGDRLQMVRQPDNFYDENAVEIHWRNGRLQLGHLPAAFAKAIAPLLDAGSAIRCYAMNSGNGAGWSVWMLLVSERLSEVTLRRRTQNTKSETQS